MADLRLLDRPAAERSAHVTSPLLGGLGPLVTTSQWLTAALAAMAIAALALLAYEYGRDG